MSKRKQEKPTGVFQNVPPNDDDDEEEDYDPYYKTRTSPQKVKKPKISSPKQATPSPKASPKKKPYTPTIATAETSANAQQATANLDALLQAAERAENAQQPTYNLDALLQAADILEAANAPQIDVPQDIDQQPGAVLIPTGGQEARPFKCPFCVNVYKAKQGMQRHMQRNHPGQQPDAVLIPTGEQGPGIQDTVEWHILA